MKRLTACRVWLLVVFVWYSSCSCDLPPGSVLRCDGRTKLQHDELLILVPHAFGRCGRVQEPQLQPVLFHIRVTMLRNAVQSLLPLASTSGAAQMLQRNTMLALARTYAAGAA